MDNSQIVCTNSNCFPDKQGDNVIHFSDEVIPNARCPVCDRDYFKIRDVVYTLHDSDEITINSLLDFLVVIDNSENDAKYIKKLHLSDISDSENFSKIISFKNCFIEELVIQNVDLQTTCFPISFDGCIINSVSIINNNIREDQKKDFLGSYLFYGINFNECKVLSSFDIVSYVGDIIIKSCELPKIINISDSTLILFSLINNSLEPEINLINSTIDKKYVLSLPQSNSDLASENQSHGKECIGEYIVKDNENEIINISNMHIDKLVFPENSEINSLINIDGCTINNLKVGAKCFNKSVKFTNCCFMDTMQISNTVIKGSLILEVNNYNSDVVINEVVVGGDLHLSYSTFTKNLYINHSNISGYFIMHQAKIAGNTKFEYVSIEHDFTMVDCLIEKLKLDSCTILQETRFKKSKVGGQISILYSNFKGGLTLTGCELYDTLNVNNSKIDSNFQIETSIIHDSVDIGFSTISERVFFMETAFDKGVLLQMINMSMLIVASNRFYEKFTCNTYSSIQKSTIIQNNIFYEELDFDQITLVDQSFSSNHFFNTLSLTNVDGDDIKFDSNNIKYLEVENVVCGGFELKSDEINRLKINDVLCQKQFKADECSFKSDVLIKHSKFIRSIILNYCEFSNSLEIISNNIGYELKITNGEIDPNIYNENEEKKKLYEVNFWIKQNNFYNVTIHSFNVKLPLFFEKNLITGNMSILGEDSISSFHSGVSISKNRIGAIETQDINFGANACLYNNHIEGGMAVENCVFSGVLDLFGSYFGGSARFLSCDFKDILILDDTLFDKRLDFVSSFPLGVSINNATLRGFSLPENWKMVGQRICLAEKGNTPILVDEQLLYRKNNVKKLTYQVASELIMNDDVNLNALRKNWIEIINGLEENQHESIVYDFLKFADYYDVINQMLKDNFFSYYYRFYDENELRNLTDITKGLSKTLASVEAADESLWIKKLRLFFADFDKIFSGFDQCQHISNQDYLHQKKSIKKLLFSRLSDQYLVIKEAYGGSGKLNDEDKAFFRWMHYSSYTDIQSNKGIRKVKSWIKWLVFEKVFGWGVNFNRIFVSTIGMVFLFTGAYWIGGRITPKLSINWDNIDIPISDIGFWDLLLLTFQTTFAAFMGDWSPAGLGMMKWWMTVNAVLGVLMVAFMIGAYGRKMLR